MAKHKSILDRLHIIEATHKVTKAMSMVAVAKREKVKQKVVHLKDYYEPLSQLFRRILSGQHHPNLAPYFAHRYPARTLSIIMASNKGLCGTFNQMICKKAKRYYKSIVKAGGQATFIPIGLKALYYCQRERIPYKGDYVWLADKGGIADITKLSEFLCASFLEGRYSQVTLIYPYKYGHPPCQELFLPFAKPDQVVEEEDDYIYEPDRRAIATELMPQMVALKLYRHLLDAQMAEHSARMVAMKKATDNAEALMKELRIIYNRLRQANITKRIIEVASALAAE